MRLLFFCSSKVREKEDKALRDFAVSGEFADAEKKLMPQLRCRAPVSLSTSTNLN